MLSLCWPSPGRLVKNVAVAFWLGTKCRSWFNINFCDTQFWREFTADILPGKNLK